MRRLMLGTFALLLVQAQAASSSFAALATYRQINDIVYQSLESAERGDLYLPERKSGNWQAPAVVWMHGNNHDKGDDRERHVGADLAAAGYVCFSINYGSWPSGRIDAKGQ